METEVQVSARLLESVDRRARELGLDRNAFIVKVLEEAVVRRAIVSHRDVVLGVSGETRKKRLESLNRLFLLFEGHDADEEVRQLKREDVGF